MNEFGLSVIEGFGFGIVCFLTVWKVFFVVHAMRGSVEDAFRND